jgi:serine protease Do
MYDTDNNNNNNNNEQNQQQPADSTFAPDGTYHMSYPQGQSSGQSGANDQSGASYQSGANDQNASYQSGAGGSGVNYHRAPKQHSGFAKVVCLCLCCALIGGLAGGGAVYAFGGTRSGSASRVLQSDRTESGVELTTVSAGSAMTCSEIFAAYNASVVSVSVETSSGTGAGTGFVISEDGLILTCYHVIDGATAMSVTFANDQESFSATYVGGDEEQDVAVLRIDAGDRVLSPVTLGDSDQLVVGSAVTAIGNALGTLSNTTTTGIVSATNRAISMSDGTVMNLLQTDCTINAGNSGGPLFNAYGEVVGIVNAKYSSSGTSTSASIEGIGFAIPINNVTSILDDLVTYGYITGKPYLGITVSTVSALTAQRYEGYVVGAYVNSVESGSCAETAGLQKGDIITAVDGEEITSSAELIDAKQNHRAGEEMQLTVYRGGESILIVVTLDEEKPDTTSSSSDAETQQDEDDDTNEEQYSYSYGYGDSYGYGSRNQNGFGFPFGR